MNLKNLYTFKKIVETGSFQAAADSLNYALSTVLFQINQLEDELSLKLFLRKGINPELTEDGKASLPIIYEIIELSDSIHAYSGKKQRPHPSLTVGIIEAFALYYLQPLFIPFKELLNNVCLSIRGNNCQKIYEQVISGEIDIGIHFHAIKYPPEFCCREIGTFPLVLIASSSFNDRQLNFTIPQQDKNICCIQYQSVSLEQDIFNQYLQKKRITLLPPLEVDNIYLLKEAVKNQLGIAYLPRFVVEEELSSGLFKEIKTEIKNSELTAVCAYNQTKPLSTELKSFIQLLEQISHPY